MKKTKIALVGNPNCGKTSLFNSLTGLNQKVGNYPGVTVTKKVGQFNHSSKDFEIIDLPGTYSLNAKSKDEKVTTEILQDSEHKNFPDLVVYVADSSNLKRSLLLYSQMMDLGIPTILALNMLDVAKANGINVNSKLLAKTLEVPVVLIDARNSNQLIELKDQLLEPPTPSSFLPNVSTPSILKRFEKIESILLKVETKSQTQNQTSFNLDSVFLHPILGYVIFLSLLILIFQAIFAWSSYPMEWIESGFGFLINQLSSLLPEHVLSRLITDGILSGLSGLFIFIPQIALLFFFISVLEDSGYMVRVSFMLDKLFQRFGLNGKSVIPLLGGLACAVPAIMGARTINNDKERLLTILVTPLMTCSARIPVYILIISIIIPQKTIFGFLNYQGLALMALYFMGIAASFLVALVFKYLIQSDQRSSFIMEMPEYQIPRWKNVFIHILNKVKVFVVDAGKIIVAISILLWGLSSYGPTKKWEQIDENYKEQKITSAEYASQKLENSYIGIFGRTIEPIIAPLGYDWKMGIALITSFAAREVFVGTMATIYSIEDTDNITSIREKMLTEKNKDTKTLRYSFATGMSLLIFYAFAMQCMSTLAIVYSETKKWKWPLIQFLYMTGGAYLLSLITYQILK